MLNEKYLRNLHTSLIPAQPGNLICYNAFEEEREFVRQYNKLTFCVLGGMFSTIAPAIVFWVSTLPY